MTLESFIPAKCWIAPEIPTAIYRSGATTLPVYVFGLIRRGVTPLINAVSVVMLTASIVLVLASLLVQRRDTSLGKGAKPDDEITDSPDRDNAAPSLN